MNPKNLYDPEQNIIAGTRYQRFLCNHFPDKSSPHGCNIDLVLAGYNAGEGAVRKYGGIPPYRETQHYVRNVKERYARLSGDRTVLASHPVQPFKPKPILVSGELMFGDYHAALVVYGNTAEEAAANGARAYSTFLNAGGYRFTKAGLSAPATFFSQVPGSKERPRSFPKS